MQIHYIRTFFKNKDTPSFCKVNLGSLTQEGSVLPLGSSPQPPLSVR